MARVVDNIMCSVLSLNTESKSTPHTHTHTHTHTPFKHKVGFSIITIIMES